MNRAEFAHRFPGMQHSASAVPAPVPWLVDGLWLKGKLTALLAPEKTGKSRFIAFLLAQMLATPQGGPVMLTQGGYPFWQHHGFKKILYLNAEEREVDVQARINILARAQGLEPRDDWPITYVNAAGMQLQKPDDRKAFEELYLAPREHDVLIIDPLRRVHTGDENNNSAMAPLHNDLRRWSNHYDLTQIVVHHTPKLGEDADLNRLATWSRGATDFATLVDGANMLWTTAAASDHSVKMLKRMGRFPMLPDLQLVDYGDPAGWCVSVNVA